MAEPATPVGSSPSPAAEVCSRCSKTLTADDRVPAADRVFCRSCYETLRMQLEQAVTQISSDVNYPMAVLGAVLGGGVGVLLWWGFTVVTHVSFGLVAVAIGFLVAHGAMRFAGGKRSFGLQALSVVVSLASFCVATYLVNMTFINRELARRGDALRVGFPPQDPSQFLRVFSMGFGVMDVVFLAIVVWQAWRIPAPPRLPERPAP